MFGKCSLALLSVCTMNCYLNAQEQSGPGDPGECNRLYIGAFGGEMYSNSSKISQMGTALYLESAGGPLAVEALGDLNKSESGFGGVQLGYEWSKCPKTTSSGWCIAPAIEVEGYWYSAHRKGHLMNATDTERLPEHDFFDTFHVDAGVYLANVVFSLNNCWGLSPYVSAGFGATRLSIRNAKSLQLAPPEPGINHFNSSRNDAAWAFAAQAKAGLRYNIGKFHIFGEYRYSFVDFSNYTFGSTVYPTHPHTTPWNVKIKNIQYNAFAFGVQLDL